MQSLNRQESAEAIVPGNAWEGPNNGKISLSLRVRKCMMKADNFNLRAF